jgi:glucose-1-phosphate thymidylyltransferase
MDRRMVTVARSLGAWVKFCGSGGAVVCATTDTAARDELARALHDARFQTMPVTPGRVGTGSGSRAGTGTASSDAPGTSTASAPDAPASVPLCDGGLRAVVLAAGFATRLWPLTKDKAKPLLEVGGETMLDRLLRQLEATGAFQDVVVVTNDRFHQAFVDWRAGWTGLPVHVVNDGAPDNDSRLGAVADLALALDEAPPPARPVTGHCVAAGDNLLDESFVEHITHCATSGVPQLVVRRLPSPVPPGKYSEICFDDAQRITSFREKPADPRSNWSALAMYLLPPELPALVATYLSDPEALRDAPGSFIAWLCEQGPVEARPLGGRWFDIGDRTQLDEARAWAADAD